MSKYVFMCLEETNMGPFFSTFNKAKAHLTDGEPELANHDFVDGDYPVIVKIKLDDESVYMDR